MSFYVHFLKVIITACFCLAPIIDCHNSRTSDIRRNAGGWSVRLISVKDEKKHPILYYFAQINWCILHVRGSVFFYLIQVQFSSQDVELKENYFSAPLEVESSYPR
jgi:hypothetical protein